MLLEAKTLIKSAPSAATLRTYSWICSGVSRASFSGRSAVRIRGPGSTPRLIALRASPSIGLPTLCTVVNPAISVTYAFSSAYPSAVTCESSRGWYRPSGPKCQAICTRSEEHTSELQSLRHLVCRLLLEKKKDNHLVTGYQLWCASRRVSLQTPQRA